MHLLTSLALMTLTLSLTLESYNQLEAKLEYMICSYKISLAEYAMWKKSTNSDDVKHMRARTFFLYWLKKVDL